MAGLTADEASKLVSCCAVLRRVIFSWGALPLKWSVSHTLSR
jgi:hypothetical protein